MNSEIESWRDRVGWGGFFAMFAWERSRPALAYLELDFDLDQIQPVAQKFVLSWDAWYRDHNEKASEEERNAAAQEILDGALRRLTSALGAGGTVRLLTFAASIPPGVVPGGRFVRWAQAWLAPWPRVVYPAAAPPAFDRGRLFRFNDLLLTWQQSDLADIRRVWRLVESTPLSDLERSAFPPRGPAPSGHLGSLQSVLYLQPSRTLWGAIRTTLSPDELDALVLWLNQQDRLNEAAAQVPIGRLQGLDDIR